VEEALRDSEGGFRAIFDNANDGILLADEETKKFYTSNNTACQMLGYSLEEIKNLGVPDIHPKEDLPYVIEQFEKQVRREIAVAKDLPVKRKDGSIFYADVNTSLVILAGRTYLLGIFRDVTEHKRAEEEREKLIQELQKALAEVKTLSGLIPICASCKKIRDDKGYWNQIESYISDHSEAEFSHGICPDCMKKLYPDFADDKSSV
jgi:PAS domain S-box-containing protein